MKKQTILIRMPNWIGDFVMALPVLANVRRHFPTAHLIVLCRKPLENLLTYTDYVDERITFEKKRSVRETWHLIMQLKKLQVDLGILMTNSFSSALWFFLAKVKKRCGYQNIWRKFLLNMPIKRTKALQEGHLRYFYLHILRFLQVTVKETEPQITMRDWQKEKIKERLRFWGYQDHLPLVGIHAGAAYGEAKRWPFLNFLQLAEQLIQKGYQVIFFGETATAMQKDAHPRMINATGKTSLKDLIAMIACCDVFVSNDSGPMHIASALHLPIVALFGSTDETITGPSASAIVINKHVPCAPCFKRNCSKGCMCMKSIRVNEVLQAVEKQVESRIHV